MNQHLPEPVAQTPANQTDTERLKAFARRLIEHGEYIQARVGIEKLRWNVWHRVEQAEADATEMMEFYPERQD